jgi:hypothetical protein
MSFCSNLIKLSIISVAQIIVILVNGVLLDVSLNKVGYYSDEFHYINGILTSVILLNVVAPSHMI